MERRSSESEEDKIIYFYDEPSERVKAEHIFLNNYHISPFTVDGKLYQTVEHYYQAQKFIGEDAKEMFEEVRNSENADKAKQLAKTYQKTYGTAEYWEEWGERKVDVMKIAIKEKFTQNLDLKEELIKTGNAHLSEDSPRDAFWGGQLENSKDMLGILLMEYRDSLQPPIKE
jgi:ribA/ribD-fused uncharacterized protein